MRRWALILSTATFAVGCFGLFLFLLSYESTFGLGAMQRLPLLTKDLLRYKAVLLIAPIPAVLFNSWRRNLSADASLMYVALLALCFAILFFTVAVVATFPWTVSM
ncbi:MAG: hypothetical protein NTX27_06125 [Verrucomicrobia bacterium]|jgi:hypothetical protein|nr:hypothetical protein [Verrucomicrobiota bacterium]